MMMLWMLLLVSTVRSHKVIESTEDVSPPPFNLTTTLYPVTDTNTTKTEEKHKIKSEATAWKIETAYVEKNATSKEEGNSTNVSEDFKPSPHVGDFFELEGLESPPTQTPPANSDVKKEPPMIYGSPVDPKPYKNKVFFKPDFPYKMESPYTRATDSWKPYSLEAQPTLETPAKVPAGGLYKFPAFKDKPALDDDDFGLQFFHKEKGPLVRKRMDPWKRLLQLATALIPVGLIVSALTPGLITVRDTANTGVYTPNVNQLYTRRSDVTSQLPSISERCRRRLLCELHSDGNYSPPSSSSGRRGRRKPCYKIPCEDTAAMSHALHWLLSYRPPHNNHIQPFT